MSPHGQTLGTTQNIRRARQFPVVPPTEDPTLKFFIEGDELEEATQRAAVARAPSVGQDFDNDNGEESDRDTLVLHDRDLGSLHEVSFEDRARKRGGLIGMAVLTSLAAIGVAGWMWMTAPALPGLDWFRQRDATAGTPKAATAPALAPAAEAPTAKAPTATAAVPAPVAPAMAKPAAAPIVEPIVSERDDDPTPEPVRTTHAANGRALRGYAWSPTAKAIVPSLEKAEAAEPVAAPSNPDAPMPSSMVSGPGIAPPSTGPAPDENARVPTTEPSPFPQPAVTPATPVAPAKSSAPILD